MYFVYILKCKDGSLYTGITTDVARRFKEHKEGRGGAYTRAKKAMKIVHIEKYKNRSKASKREAEIKNLRRSEKYAIIRA